MKRMQSIEKGECIELDALTFFFVFSEGIFNMTTDVEKYALKNNYDKYSKFKNVDEFNDHFNKAMYYHKDKFTKSEHIALKKLSKFAFSNSCINTIGVAWSRGQIVVAATHKERKCDNETFGISRSTFDRMLRKAKKLNLIKVINQYRKNKSQKHNLYVFNKFEELTPEKFEIVPKSNTINEPKTIAKPLTLLLELPRLKELNNTYQQAENVPVDKNVDKNAKEDKEPKPKPKKPETAYQQVTKKISGLFKEKTIANRIYGVWVAQTTRPRNKPPIEIALQALHVLIAEIKRRIACELKPLRTPVGYFNGILKNMLDKFYEEQYENASHELFAYQDEINNDHLQIFNT